MYIPPMQLAKAMETSLFSYINDGLDPGCIGCKAGGCQRQIVI